MLFDWKSGATESTTWLVRHNLSTLCIGLLTVIVGIKRLHQNREKNEKKMVEFLGFVLVVIGVFLMGVFAMLLL